MVNEFLNINGIDRNRLYEFFLKTELFDKEIFDLLILKENIYYIKDSIYDLIELPEYIRLIIDTTEFQRLHYIKQLGFAHLVYPGAMHTRFSHSLGVYHLAQTYLKKFIFNGIQYQKRQNHETSLKSEFINPIMIKIFLVSSLLHDIGHPPFSHVIESEFSESHQTIGAKLIEKVDPTKGYNVLQKVLMKEVFKTRSDEILKTLAFMIEEDVERDRVKQISDICEIFDIRKNILLQLKKIMHLILDRVDYLLRDSYNCGLKYGDFEYKRLLNNIGLNFTKYYSSKFFIFEKGLDSYKCLLSARLYMYRNCYYHKTIRSINRMIVHAVAIKKKYSSPKELFAKWQHQTDELIWRDLIVDDDIFNTLRLSLIEKEFENFSNVQNCHDFLIRSIFKRDFYKRILTFWRFDFGNTEDLEENFEKINNIFLEGSELNNSFNSFKREYSLLISKMIINELQVKEKKIYEVLFAENNFTVFFDHPVLNITRKEFKNILKKELDENHSLTMEFKDYERPYVIFSNQFINLPKKIPKLLFRRNNDEDLLNLELENHKTSCYYHPLRVFIIKKVPFLSSENGVQHYTFEENFFNRARFEWNKLINARYSKLKGILPFSINVEM